MHASHKLSNIELEMYKQYMGELRAKRAANFEARNVQTVWNNDMHPSHKLAISWARNVQKVYGWNALKARSKFWS